jgi:competence protein ComK
MLELRKIYMINQLLMYMAGIHDRNGKLCTLVKEKDSSFLVDQSPIEILSYSIQCIGFDLRGALATSKWILGDDILMHPIMVNPILKICMFPNKSMKQYDTIWFNPFYIIRTSGGRNRTTIVEFQNGQKMTVNSQLSSFNHKLQTAEQLRNMTINVGRNPASFILDPKKRRVKTKRKTK